MGRHSAGRSDGDRRSDEPGPTLGPITDPVLLDRVQVALHEHRAAPRSPGARSRPHGPRAEAVDDVDEVDADERLLSWAPPRPATGRVTLPALPREPAAVPPDRAEPRPGPAERREPRPEGPEVPAPGSAPRSAVLATGPAARSADEPPAMPRRTTVPDRAGLSLPTAALVVAVGAGVGVLISVLAVLRYPS